MDYLNITCVHPCKKSNRIFFDTNCLPFIICNLFDFVICLIFIHTIFEVVNINSVNFCWISTFGYTSVTFWNGQPDVALVWFMQWTRMALKHGEKTGFGVLLESMRFVWKYYKLPKTCRHTHYRHPINAAQLREAFQEHWLVTVPPSLPCGLSLS